MSLTLTPSIEHIYYPEDFRDGYCRINVRSEISDMDSSAPLLTMSVEGPFRIATEQNSTYQRKQELSHRQLNNAWFISTLITLVPNPSFDESSAKLGKLILTNEANRLVVPIVLNEGLNNENGPLPRQQVAKRSLGSTLVLIVLILLGLAGAVWWVLLPPEQAIPPTITNVSATSIRLEYDSTLMQDRQEPWRIERSTDSLAFRKVATLAERQWAWVDTGLTPNTRYWYRCVAVGRFEDSPPSNVVDTTTRQRRLSPWSVLKAPGNLRALYVSHGQIKLTWDDLTTNEDSFDIERSSDRVTFARISQVRANVETFLDREAHPDSVYYYRVRAINSHNKSPYSAIVSVNTTPDNPKPQPPGPTPTPPETKTYHTGLIMEPDATGERDKQQRPKKQKPF